MRAENETLTFTHIPDKAMVQVFLKVGTCFIGTLRQSAGWPWVSVKGQEPFSLADVSPTFAEVEAITVVSDKPSTEEETRKYGGNCIHAADNETGLRRHSLAARRDGDRN